MMDSNTKISTISNLLKQVLVKMIDTRNKQVSTNLPQIPVGLAMLSQNLDKTDFTLVVSGEVNRGKSTFINAIIGQDILPTFDKETTSQVFKIKNSDSESYNIIYENGDVKGIKRDELVKYGTQIDHAGFVSQDERRILYIEICIPISILPQGITIVDTPGIGSTYKHHTEIAKTFMQQADAIIYLCSSKHPIVKVDIDFIKNVILPIPTSPNIIFVMAKADQADNEDALNNLVKRAESQLVEHFPNNKAINKKVIPIDSLSLKDSNNAESEEVKNALLVGSNYEAVNNAINELIERQRFCWIISAYNCAAQYYKKVNAFLEKQISEYDLSEATRESKLKSTNNRIEQFECNYGITFQRKTLEEINNILSSMRDALKDIFISNNSYLRKKYYQKVDDIPPRTSADELNSIAQTLSEDILSEATEEWENTSSFTLSKIQSVVNSFHNDCQLEVENEYQLGQQNASADIDLNISMSDRLQAMKGEFFTGSFISTAVTFGINALAAKSATIAAYVGAISGPLGWILVAGGGALAYGLIWGNRKAKEKAVKKAKEQIKGHLSDILTEIYNSLTKTSLMDGKHESMLKLFENSVRNNASETITTIYKNTLSDLETSRNGLLGSSKPANRTNIVNQQALWNTYAVSLKKLAIEIKEIDATL